MVPLELQLNRKATASTLSDAPEERKNGKDSGNTGKKKHTNMGLKQM